MIASGTRTVGGYPLILGLLDVLSGATRSLFDALGYCIYGPCDNLAD